jgi:hypothetical protein
MYIEFKNMEDNKVWEITPKVSIPKGRKIISGSHGFLLAKMMGAIDHAVLLKGLVKSLEIIFKIIMLQS